MTAKNFNDVSAEVITDKVLLKLGIHILATEYLEDEVFCFTKVTLDNKKTNEEAETFSNSKKKLQ